MTTKLDAQSLGFQRIVQFLGRDSSAEGRGCGSALRASGSESSELLWPHAIFEEIVRVACPHEARCAPSDERNVSVHDVRSFRAPAIDQCNELAQLTRGGFVQNDYPTRLLQEARQV